MSYCAVTNGSAWARNPDAIPDPANAATSAQPIIRFITRPRAVSYARDMDAISAGWLGIN